MATAQAPPGKILLIEKFSFSLLYSLHSILRYYLNSLGLFLPHSIHDDFFSRKWWL